MRLASDYMSVNKRRGGFLATAEGVKKLKEAKRIRKYTYQQIAEAANETEDKVKRLFNPQWGNGKYKVGEEAVQAICNVLDVKPEEIVSDWFFSQELPIESQKAFKLSKIASLWSYEYNTSEPYNKAIELIEKAYKNKVKSLWLSYRDITKIPPQIGKLKELKYLYLESNISLKCLPKEIENLKNLEYLSLYRSSFEELPLQICKLTNLKELDLRKNKIKTITSEIKFLKNLRVLRLEKNKLDKIPNEIGCLTNLEELELNYNYLTELPIKVGKLINLKYLHLFHNLLDSIPSEIGCLQNLISLSLTHNKITKLPLEIKNLNNLVELGISNNLLPLPPEIIDRVNLPDEIFHYYFSLQQHHKKPIHEAKMLVVGQPNVGKTCLKERFLRNKYNSNRSKTDGIDIEKWKIEIEDKKLQVNIWDFGGQEIMHSTHQFFLTKRSFYLLVLDTTIGEEENRIEYWLKIIQSFGKDAPVVIVGNKADQHPLDIDKTGLKNKYPQIKAFFEISCETGQEIAELAEFAKQEINQLEHIDDLLPLPWFNVKEKLEELDKDFIPYEQYETLCEEEGIDEADKQGILIRLLNDLGIVLNFQDDPRLEDTHVLNPEWVTNGVYKILNDRQIIVEDRGILKISELKRILSQQRYPPRKHLFITGMMRKFELCFDLEPDKQFLIPDILPKEEPHTGEWDKTLAFEYHYPVLPGSIISRFIVRMNHYISKHTYWRSGVVLEHEGNLALVKADREDKIIKIRVKGKDNTRRNLLTAIRSQFDYIHKTIPGIVPIEKVPLIDYPEIVLDYQELLGLEAMGKISVDIGRLRISIPLTELLDGITIIGDR